MKYETKGDAIYNNLTLIHRWLSVPFNKRVRRAEQCSGKPIYTSLNSQ